SFNGSLGSPTAQFTVSGTHTYAEEGTYHITVSIRHENVFPDASATPTATVTDAPLTPGAPTAIPTLYNTGLDDFRKALADKSADPHFRLIASADPGNPGPAAYRIDPIPWTPLPNNATSNWIGTKAPPDAPSGFYDYETT